MHESLDAGIAPYVQVLVDAGIDTYESCQGGNGHAVAEPIVRFHGDNSEGFRALPAGLSAGLPIVDLRRFWQIVDGEPCGPYWEMSFRTTAERSASTGEARPCRSPGCAARCCCPQCTGCCCDAPTCPATSSGTD
jgi:hypothetical protein